MSYVLQDWACRKERVLEEMLAAMMAEDPGEERSRARLLAEQKIAEAGLYVALVVTASGPQNRRHLAAEGVAAGVTREVLANSDGTSVARILMSLGSVEMGQVSQCEEL
mgnify:FL=1